MEDYAGNSHKGKEQAQKKEKPPVKKIVKGEVVSRPPTIGARIKTVFFGGEAREASRYLMGEVLLPAFRNLVVDTVRIGVERVVYGDSARRPGRPMMGSSAYGNDRYGYAPKVTYNTPPTRPGEAVRGYLPDQPGTMRSRQRGANEIYLSTRGEAEEVLSMMMEIIDQYTIVSVADFYEMVGLPSSHIDNRWGWTMLHDVDIRQTRDGYLIDLPNAEPI